MPFADRDRNLRGDPHSAGDSSSKDSKEHVTIAWSHPDEGGTARPKFFCQSHIYKNGHQSFDDKRMAVKTRFQDLLAADKLKKKNAEEQSKEKEDNVRVPLRPLNKL